MKSCVQCLKGFETTEDDRIFYQKMHVPEPTRCPQCRAIRRLAFRNERSLYKRNCGMCGKEIVALYRPDSPWIVYCPSCWHSDAWNGTDYGIDVDFSRPFFEQFYQLKLTIPRVALDILKCANSDYSNISIGNKNCYLVFGITDSEDCYYSRKVLRSRNCMDVNNVYGCELLYESVQCSDCYNIDYSQNCFSCTDSRFLRDCTNCTACMFCSGLKNKQYCYFNKQLTEKEYREKVSALRLDSYSGLCDAQKRFVEFDITIPKRFSQNRNCENSSGDYLKNCKNCFSCFDMGSSEDCRYCTDALNGTSDSMDCTAVGMTGSMMVYESQSCTGSSFLRFCNGVRNASSHIDYSDAIYSSHELFGCAGLKTAQYCILNKQYTAAEYAAVKEKIIEHMKFTGEWGEFFPAAHSPFGYNESIGNDFARIEEARAKEMGLNWSAEAHGMFGKETMKSGDIPDSIHNTEDSIIKDIFSCKTCGKDYKLIRQELDVYRKKILPLPRECPDCRNYRRILLFNPRTLWQRQCMSSGCANEFETTFAPDRSEIVYCETCYQKEML